MRGEGLPASREVEGALSDIAWVFRDTEGSGDICALLSPHELLPAEFAEYDRSRRASACQTPNSCRQVDVVPGMADDRLLVSAAAQMHDSRMTRG